MPPIAIIRGTNSWLSYWLQHTFWLCFACSALIGLGLRLDLGPLFGIFHSICGVAVIHGVCGFFCLEKYLAALAAVQFLLRVKFGIFTDI